MSYKKNTPQDGISLIEVLLAIAIFTLFVASLGTIGLSGMLMSSDAVERFRATLVARESLEALRTIRMKNFSELALGTHGLSFSGGRWQLTPSPDSVDEFTRSVTISSPSAGRVLAQVNVTWPLRVGGVGSVGVQTFINQLYGSRWTHTTVADFDGGRLNGTQVGSDGGGAILLESAGDWTQPNESLSYDLSDIGTLSAMAEADGVLSLASSAAGTKPLVALDLADAGRGTLTMLGSVDVGATVNAIAVSGDYLYLATDSDTEELIVLHRSDLSVARTLDLATGADALSLTATGTTLYLGRANSTSFELYEFNIADPPAGISTVRTADFAGSVNALALSDPFLFVGTSDATELLVVQTSNLSITNSLDLPGGADVRALVLYGIDLYVSRDQSVAQEIVRIDVTDPLTGLVANDGADVSGSVLSLAIGSDDRLYAATALPNSEVIAYALPSFLSPAVHDVLVGAGARTLLSVGPYVYVGLENNNPELVVLRGGSGEWEPPLLRSSINLASNTDGVSVAMSGNYAYVGTARSSNGEFSVINIMDPSLPILVNSLEINADVNAMRITGPYAYLATSDNNRELIVVNIADPNNPVIVGVYDSAGSSDGAAVAVSGTSLVLGTKNSPAGAGREVYLLDITNPALPTLTASFEVGADVNGAVFLAGGYIGLATANNAKELMIVNANVMGSLTEAASYNTAGNADALSIAFANNTHVILGTEDNGSSPDFFVFAFNSLSGAIAFMSSLDLAADNSALAVANDDVFVGNNFGGAGFTVVNIENPSVAQQIGTLLFDGVIRGVATDGVYAYVASMDNNREFSIVGPSALSTLFAQQGWLTSSPFDSGSTGITWGTIAWTQVGAGTSTLQVRTSETQAGLTNAAWVGSGGTRGGVFMGGESTITPYPLADGLRWIQYRAGLLGDGTSTPAVVDVTITYN